MERQVYRDVIIRKIKHFDVPWFLHNAYIYLFLKIEGILKTGYSPPPLACGLTVTENCNMRCPMCVLPHRFKENPIEKDTTTWKRVIDQLHDLGIGGIAISGGEATLRKDSFDLLNHASGRKTTVTLNSNMVSLTDERIRELARVRLNNINVSIDSGRDEINDKLRGGKDVLPRVLNRIAALVEERKKTGGTFTITAVTTLSDLNVDDLDILFEKTAKAGADRICFIPLHDIKDGITYLVRSKKVKNDLFKTLVRLSAHYNLPLENSTSYLREFHHVMTGGVMKETCNAGYTHVVVGADLKIYRCIPYMNTGRHLFTWDPAKQTLKELWNSRAWREDRLKARSCKECFWDCHAELTFLVPM